MNMQILQKNPVLELGGYTPTLHRDHNFPNQYMDYLNGMNGIN